MLWGQKLKSNFVFAEVEVLANSRFDLNSGHPLQKYNIDKVIFLIL
jgi:hypothetical protein